MAERLCLAEGARIEALSESGTEPDVIAVLIGGDRSTVYRELARGRDRESVYRAEPAQAAADRRARRPRVCKLDEDPGLAEQVRSRLERGWSPHAISADVADAGRRVCAETVYRCVYSGRALGADAWRDLPRRRRCRKRRARSVQKASPLGDYRPISERPAEAADRSEAGHWKGDLIVGAHNKSAAATLVERTSRHTLVVALPDGYAAPHAAGAVTAALVRSLTWDQGREMARWADIETALGIEVYLCDAHSPWQRPTNEQTNGLLRRWLPNRTPLDLNPLKLSVIEDNLNWMPRRLHNWASAADIYTRLSRNHR